MSDEPLAKRPLKVLVDSSVYGAAIEDEERYPSDSQLYWDVVYPKALLRLQTKISIYGCKPVEAELSEAPQAYRRRLLETYDIATPLRESRKVVLLYSEYVTAGIHAPDALILAHASALKMDALVTINRRHLKTPETTQIVRRVSRNFALRPILILLPRELFELIRQA